MLWKNFLVTYILLLYLLYHNLSYSVYFLEVNDAREELSCVFCDCCSFEFLFFSYSSPDITHQVWREKNVIKPAPGKRRCNCRNEVYHRQIGPGMFQQMTEQVCDQCQNIKHEREGYSLTVDIEKGMQDGQEVVFYEDGEPKVDGEPGDLKFRIRTSAHDVFTRKGNDLHTTVTITLVQALVGFEKKMKHLDEHLVDISTQGITKPKEVRKFKGEGMPLYTSTKKGDLYVTFEVLFPSSLTQEQKTKIKDILG
ncbi:DnaJ protein ERDJ3B [Linum perenne]